MNILNNNGNVSKLNDPLICLIPKVRQPNTLTNFIHIPLCNVTFKIMTKATADRIKHTLNGIINPYQSAFIPEKLITDNIILSYEAFRTLNRNQSTKKGYVGIKLDMEKAYDRLE